MSNDLNIFLDETIENNLSRASKRQYLTLKEIVGYEAWKIVKKLDLQMDLGLRFWHTCAEFGYRPTEEREHKARIYHNYNYGG